MSTIVMSNTDPGEGSPLQSDNFLAIYGGKSLLDMFYPVGSVYMSMDSSFDPNISWGGIWVKIESGRFIEATTADAQVGTTVAAGLPNIKGMGHYADNNGDWSGALYNVGNANYIGDGSASGTRIGLDASRYNSIYGNSDTVQPNSIKAFIWRRTA